MNVTRKSVLSGMTRTMDLPITQEQMDRWKRGQDLIQDVFPELDADQREFILSGITSQEWDDEFGEDDE